MRLRWILALFLVLTVASVSAQDEEGVYGTVYQTTNVRSGPDPRFEIVGQLSENDRVLVDGRESAAGRWLHVVLTEGDSGWVPSFALILDADLTALPIITPVTESQNPTTAGEPVTVRAYGLVNVRGGPGIDFEIVGQLDLNDEADAIARSNNNSDWLHIIAEDLDGWVAYFTVYVEGDPDTLPVLVPDSSGEGLIPPAALVRTRFNTRLHAEPNLSSPVITTVPFDQQVTPIARTERGDWIYVGFEGEEGWGVRQLFFIDTDAVRALPLFDSVQATPEVTAEAP